MAPAGNRVGRLGRAAAAARPRRPAFARGGGRLLAVVAGPGRNPPVPPAIVLDQEVEDLQSVMMRNRIVFFGGRMDDSMASKLVASLLALDAVPSETGDSTIRMYINSPGAMTYSAFGVLDVMDYVKADVSTVGIGAVSAMSSLVMAGGTKGKRYSMANTRIMISQPFGGAEGSTDEVMITGAELSHQLKRTWALYQKYTGLDLETVQEEINRDNFMGPKRALELNIIDGIIDG